MDLNGNSFMGRVLNIIKEETRDEVPLIRFKQPKELEKILDLDLTTGVSDDDLERSVREILHYSVKTNKVTFRNQLFGGTDPYGLAGAWLAEAFNTSQYTFEVAPAFTLVENHVIRHMLQLFGLGDGDGLFSPGGSVSMMYAIVAARHHAFPEVKSKGMKGLPDLILFSSEDSHYSIKKAAHWLGFGIDNLRIIPTDERGRMDVELLDKSIQKEKDEGRYPLMVNATAGTTVLGAIDDLPNVASLCRKHGVWMHVDACWGGSLILSKRHRSKLNGIESADSIAWNPHKMLGAPLQCSALLLAGRSLQQTNAAAAEYLFQQDKCYDTRYDTGDKSVQCGRKIDAFKLWVMWKARGDTGLGSSVDSALQAASIAFSAIQSRCGFRAVTQPPPCPNVCFWYIPAFMREKDEDDHWWETMHKITPKIKELLTLNAELMVAYCPHRRYKNFFRMAITCHPEVTAKDIVSSLDAIERAGESLTPDMF